MKDLYAMRRVRYWPLLLLSLLLSLLLGCGGQGDSAPNRIVVSGGLALLAIEVTPAAPTLAIDASLELVASGILSNGTSQNFNRKVQWESSDSTVAQVSADGRVTAHSAGRVTLTASYLGKSGSTSLSVTDARLTRLEIVPHNPQLAKDAGLNLAALAYYDDGSIQDVTAQVTWASFLPEVATVGYTAGSKGLLSALAAGNTTITASLDDLISADIDVTVTAAQLVALAIEPANPSLLLGTWGTQLVATGFYDDGSLQDLTRQVAWRRNSNAIAFADTPAMAGQVLAQVVGSARVQAALGGKTAETSLTVRAAKLQTIDVSPASDILARGDTQVLRALGHFDDDTVVDISNQLIWKTSAPAVMAVSNAAGSRGLVTALSAGDADITAELTVDGGNVVSGRSRLKVTSARLQSIRIEPASPQIAPGTRQALRAIGQYDDDRTVDVTDRVSWTTVDTAVARISNARGLRGIVRAGSTAGSTDVTAMLDGVTSGAVALTVVDAALTGLRIVAPATTLAAGAVMRLTAMGDFDDGSSQDLTDQVGWFSADPDLAWVSNVDGTRGQVTAGAGVTDSVEITAIRPGVSPVTFSLDVSN